MSVSHGSVIMSPHTSSGCVETSVNVTTASVILVPANPNRKGVVIFNNSSNSVYVKYAATSVASTCTKLIATYASWEPVSPVCYTGPISAIRNSGSGVVTVFELI